MNEENSTHSMAARQQHRLGAELSGMSADSRLPANSCERDARDQVHLHVLRQVWRGGLEPRRPNATGGQVTRPLKWESIRVIKRMTNVIEEQLAELGYKEEKLTDARLHVKALVRALTNYLEDEA